MSNIDVTPGNGKTVGTETIAAVEYQQIKLVDATAASTTPTGVAANPLQVSIANTGANSTPLVVASHAVTNAGTFAVQAAQSGTWTVQPGNTANTTAWKVDGSAVTQPVSGTVTANMGTVTADPFGANADASSATGSISAKLRFIASTGIPITGTVTVGSHAVTNAGTFAVQNATAASTIPAATTMQNAATANGNGTNLPVTGYTTAILNIVSSPAMSGGTTVNFEASVDDVTFVSIIAHQVGVTGSLSTTATADGDFRINSAGYKSIRARISAYSAGTVTIKGYTIAISGQSTTVSLATGSSTIGALTANQSVNVAQINGVTPLMGAGNTGTGSARVTIASDQAVIPISDNSGSLTVDAPVGTPVFATITPSTTGGWSVFNATSGDGSTALTNSAQAVKASAGTLGGWYIYNPNATAMYVPIYNVASGSVTVGTTNPAMVLTIPATSAANLELSNGIQFGTAIAIAAATTAGGASAPGTALEANFWYK